MEGFDRKLAIERARFLNGHRIMTLLALVAAGGSLYAVKKFFFENQRALPDSLPRVIWFATGLLAYRQTHGAENEPEPNTVWRLGTTAFGITASFKLHIAALGLRDDVAVVMAVVIRAGVEIYAAVVGHSVHSSIMGWAYIAIAIIVALRLLVALGMPQVMGPVITETICTFIAVISSDA